MKLRPSSDLGNKREFSLKYLARGCKKSRYPQKTTTRRWAKRKGGWGQGEGDPKIARGAFWKRVSEGGHRRKIQGNRTAWTGREGECPPSTPEGYSHKMAAPIRKRYVLSVCEPRVSVCARFVRCVAARCCCVGSRRVGSYARRAAGSAGAWVDGRSRRDEPAGEQLAASMPTKTMIPSAGDCGVYDTENHRRPSASKRCPAPDTRRVCDRELRRENDSYRRTCGGP
ncbi:unnamed protein product [Trichogramma brassicae]|uniref:Uncharacterized protein n=1 Tax=Trichogramma brassicae TaxID=86971 RepID=A0A6H5I2L1_9HYME|nr:unnamed protein product [Trichogramma brassicae]